MKGNIPVSKIGELQQKDIENSTGISFHDGVSRICTVVKSIDTHDYRDDNSSFRMADLFGDHWNHYNQHYVIQVAGCPLRCWYCYVDNLSPDIYMTEHQIVNEYVKFRNFTNTVYGVDIPVLHFMGGLPARYCGSIPILRRELGRRGQEDTVIYTDVLGIENYYYGAKPWKYLDTRKLMVVGCLKGTNKQNFVENTGKDLFEISLNELGNYTDHKNFYLSVINHDKSSLDICLDRLGLAYNRVDELEVVIYKAVKNRGETV